MSDELNEILIKLLHSIQTRDWNTYETLTSSNLSCFEPEAKGELIRGLAFHKFFFEPYNIEIKYNIELIDPISQQNGSIGYIAYTLILQKRKGDEITITKTNETRIFEKENGKWKMIHFHRSIQN